MRSWKTPTFHEYTLEEPQTVPQKTTEENEKDKNEQSHGFNEKGDI
jgi:hypothetical protein